MKNFAITFFALFFYNLAFAQDDNNFVLYCGDIKAGSEQYQLKNNNSYHIAVKLNTSYGPPIDIDYELVLNKQKQISAYTTKGQNFLWFDSITKAVLSNSHILIANGSLSRKIRKSTHQFSQNSPLPTLGLELLVQYWKSNGQPNTIDGITNNKIIVTSKGIDTILYNGKPQSLQYYSIRGLSWGECYVWINEAQKLVAAVNPMVAFKLISIRKSYESLFSFFTRQYVINSLKFIHKSLPILNKDKKITAIKNVTVWNGINNQLLYNQTIVIENGIIREVSPYNVATIPANAYIINAKGKTILPGLWESHAHLKMTEWLPAYLACGITGVRDLGNDFETIYTIDSLANTVYQTFPYIHKAGFIDGKPRFYSLYANTTAEADSLVHYYYKKGFKEIKVWNNVKKDVLDTVIKLSHKYGMKVTGHIPTSTSIFEAIDMGQDQINHLTTLADYLWEYPNDRKRLIALLKTKNVAVDPTLVIPEFRTRSKKVPISTFEPGINATPYVKKIFSSLGLPDSTVAEGKKYFLFCLDLFKELHDAGITMVAGSDQGVPGYTLIREIELYVQAGLKPVEALKLATQNPVKLLDVSSQYGSIEVGKKANLVLYDGNPTVRISDLRRVYRTIVNGKVLDSEKLSNLADLNPNHK